MIWVILAGLACAAPARTPRAAAPSRRQVTVMTYNVNFGLEGDLDTIKVIQGGGADVVFLQETTPRWERALRAALGGTYPHMRFYHAGGAGGLAVLSRLRFEEKDYLPSPAGWFPALRVVVQTPLGPLQVLSVHLHPPVSERGSVVSGYFSTRRVRHSEITAYAERLDPALPTLVVGDFNEDEDGRALAYLAVLGLRSALPEFQPRRSTWRWDTALGRITARLDHIVYDRRLLPLDVRVLDGGQSDHLAVLGTFEPAGR